MMMMMMMMMMMLMITFIIIIIQQFKTFVRYIQLKQCDGACERNPSTIVRTQYKNIYLKFKNISKNIKND